MDDTDGRVSPMAEWREEIDRMQRLLTELRVDLETASDGSELYRSNQAEADRVGYRRRAFREAQPILTSLYRDYGAAVARESSQRSTAGEDAATLTRWAMTLGIVGTVLVLAGLGMSLWWWVPTLGVALWIGCALCVRGAFSATRDQPDMTLSMRLAAQIDTLETACRDCWSLDELGAVRRLLAPPTTSDLVKPSH